MSSSPPRPPAAPGRRNLDGWALVPLRAFLGFTFTYAGLQKLANPDYLNAASPTSVQSTILALRHQSPIGWLLGLSAHAPVAVGIAIAIGELAVGLATLTGLWVRLAALGGLLLSLTFFLTVSYQTTPYYYGSDIVFLFAWSVPLISGRWSFWTLDEWVRRRAQTDPDPQRRALVLGGTAVGTLAAVTGVTAGLTAIIGRARHHTAALPDPPTPVPTATGTASTRKPNQASKPAVGRQIAAADAVPTGHAVQFSDDRGSPAWLVHEPDGSFRAFSAICTHAGCTVGFSGQEFLCPCHGGTYSASTGAVLSGPPPRPLPALTVRVVHGEVRLV